MAVAPVLALPPKHPHSCYRVFGVCCMYLLLFRARQPSGTRQLRCAASSSSSFFLLLLILLFVWCWVSTSAATTQPAALHPDDYKCQCHVCVCVHGKLNRCYKTASVPIRCICCFFFFFPQVPLKWLISSVAAANSHASWWSGCFSPLISMHSGFFSFPPDRINI